MSNVRLVFSGKRLRAEREAMGLGRLKMARRAGFVVGPEAIKRYEDGNSAPKMDVVVALAAALEIPLERLMEREDAEG